MHKIKRDVQGSRYKSGALLFISESKKAFFSSFNVFSLPWLYKNFVGPYFSYVLGSFPSLHYGKSDLQTMNTFSLKYHVDSLIRISAWPKQAQEKLNINQTILTCNGHPSPSRGIYSLQRPSKTFFRPSHIFTLSPFPSGRGRTKGRTVCNCLFCFIAFFEHNRQFKQINLFDFTAGLLRHLSVL